MILTIGKKKFLILLNFAISERKIFSLLGKTNSLSKQRL